MINQTKGTGHSVYRRGADDGFGFGIYLSAMFVAMALSLRSALASVASWAMIIAVPFIIYFYLKRSYRADAYGSTFSGLWLHGICIFFFGSLLMALTAYVYMRFVAPSYINDSIEVAKEFFISTGTEEGMANAQLLSDAQKAHLLPSAGSLAVALIWLSVFTGSILSMFESLIVRATSRPTPPPM